MGISKKTRKMKIPDNVLGKKINKVIVSSPYQRTEIKLKKHFVTILDRKKLGDWMLKKVESSGTKVSFSSPVTKIGKNFVLSNNKKIYFDYLVGGDGSSSIVRKSLHKPSRKAWGMQYWREDDLKDVEINFDYEFFGPWYGWVVPRGDLTAIGTGGDTKVSSYKKMKSNLDLWCKKRGFDLTKANFEAHLINYDFRGYKFKNKFLIGDAAGFTSGLSGEGIYFAMASGEDVARTIINKNHTPKLINEILEIKKKHELILKSFMINEELTRIQYEILGIIASQNFR